MYVLHAYGTIISQDKEGLNSAKFFSSYSYLVSSGNKYFYMPIKLWLLGDGQQKL